MALQRQQDFMTGTPMVVDRRTYFTDLDSRAHGRKGAGKLLTTWNNSRFSGSLLVGLSSSSASFALCRVACSIEDGKQPNFCSNRSTAPSAVGHWNACVGFLFLTIACCLAPHAYVRLFIFARLLHHLLDRREIHPLGTIDHDVFLILSSSR